jgi:hypothetical protein
MKRFALVIAAAWLCTTLALAEDKPQMSAEEAKMMEAWQKHATPTVNHEHLKALVGKFKAEVKCRMSADAPEQISQGQETSELIMGGRFLKTSFSGEMMGKPFKGLQLLGYDNTAKKYQGVWIDEMSTSILKSEGTGDSQGKSITLNASFDCPMTGMPKKVRMVYTVPNADQHTFEMFDESEAGKEFRSMIITYTRAE